MFIRPSTILFSAVALAGVVTAAPTEIEVRDNINQCNTGDMHCCDSTYLSSSTFVTQIFGWLNLPMPSTGSLVGMSCSPTTMGGLGSGSTCTQQPVCCTGNTFNGLINIGCSPITINM